MTGVSSRLQDRFEVVQYQQTMVIAHILDEQGYLVVYLPWQIELLLIRDKADTLPQEDLWRRGVLERTPEDIFKGHLHLHCYLCSYGRFPDTPHAQYCHNLTVMLSYPAP